MGGAATIVKFESAPVVQWIEPRSSKALMGVRFPPGAQIVRCTICESQARRRRGGVAQILSRKLCVTRWCGARFVDDAERTLSSVGRATRLHREGRRFESYRVHKRQRTCPCGRFSAFVQGAAMLRARMAQATASRDRDRGGGSRREL